MLSNTARYQTQAGHIVWAVATACMMGSLCPGSAAPCTAELSPAHPTTADTIALVLTCGVAPTSCVPLYQDLAFTLGCTNCDWYGMPGGTVFYPPRRSLTLNWTTVPPPRDSVCVDTPTAHGPVFRIPPLTAGTYTVATGPDTVTVFQVVNTGPGHTLGGWVPEGLAGFLDSVTLELRQIDSTCGGALPCVRDTMATGDSTYFEFTGLPSGRYVLALQRRTYLSRELALEIDSDQVLAPRLVRPTPPLMIAGSTAIADSPSAAGACSVRVDFGSPCDGASATVVSDSLGGFTFPSTLLEENWSYFITTARYPGLLPACRADSIFGSRMLLLEFRMCPAFQPARTATRTADSLCFRLDIAETVCSTGVFLHASYTIRNLAATSRFIAGAGACYTSQDETYLSPVSVQYSERDSGPAVFTRRKPAGPCLTPAPTIELCPSDSFVAVLPVVALYPHSDTVQYSAWVDGRRDSTFLSVMLPAADPLSTGPRTSRSAAPRTTVVWSGRGLVVRLDKAQHVQVTIVGLDGRHKTQSQALDLGPGMHVLPSPASCATGLAMVCVRIGDRMWTVPAVSFR